VKAEDLPGARTIPDEPRYLAAVQLIERCGAQSYSLRYCDEHKPLVWLAVARFNVGWKVAAALNPQKATYRLLEDLIDGGMCVHCRRTTGVVVVSDSFEPPDQLPDVCWYVFDPELKVFRRSCEGRDTG
jgi:hypothetical protein